MIQEERAKHIQVLEYRIVDDHDNTIATEFKKNDTWYYLDFDMDIGKKYHAHCFDYAVTNFKVNAAHIIDPEAGETLHDLTNDIDTDRVRRRVNELFE
jgi:hypothetical protein